MDIQFLASILKNMKDDLSRTCTINALESTLTNLPCKRIADILIAFSCDDSIQKTMINLIGKRDNKPVSEDIARLLWPLKRDASRLAVLKYLFGIVETVNGAHVGPIIEQLDFDTSRIGCLKLALTKVNVVSPSNVCSILEALRSDDQRHVALGLMMDKMPMMSLFEMDSICLKLESPDTRRTWENTLSIKVKSLWGPVVSLLRTLDGVSDEKKSETRRNVCACWNGYRTGQGSSRSSNRVLRH